MKLKLYIFLIAFFVLFLSVGLDNPSYAQTLAASNSALIAPLTTLPTLFPTITPASSPIAPFPVLDELATPSVSTSSATAPTTPIASNSAQDYCLNVPIFMYHHVEPIAIATQLGHPQLTVDSNIFESQIRYLVENNYHFLSLGDLVHAILNRRSVPDKSVVITIDDGYIDDYTYAFLMAKKYQAIMNFMIPTGLIGEADYMTWDHLKEMTASPYTRIYNHTASHAPLGLISQEQIIQEVTTANKDLKDNLDITNNIVIYPYGSYSDLAIQTLQQLGMIAAVSTDPGQNDCISNIMRLPRVRVGNEPIEDYGY